MLCENRAFFIWSYSSCPLYLLFFKEKNKRMPLPSGLGPIFLTINIVFNLSSIIKKKVLSSLQLQLEDYNLNTVKGFSQMILLHFSAKANCLCLIYLQLKQEAIHRLTYKVFNLVLLFVNQLFNNRTQVFN